MSVSYVVTKSRRTRTLRVRVLPGGEVVATAPAWYSDQKIADFILTHEAWIKKTVSKLKDRSRLPLRGRRDYLKHKESARAFITTRVLYWNQFYNYTYNRIAIKNSRSHWGSCSKKGNLNFSYQLLVLPPELADYIVVHELCHLKELNHSKKFWDLVALHIPDYFDRRKQLKKYLLN